MQFRPTECGLRRLRRDEPLDDIISAIRQDGAVIVSGLVDADIVDLINHELEPHLVERAAGFRNLDDGFYGRNTKRIQGLAAKSRGFVDHILLNDILLAAADAFLLPNCGDYWMSQAETIYIGPKSAAQALHRDDVNWSIAAGLGIDLQLSALVAMGDYDADVGATMVLVEADRDDPGPFDPERSRPVELQPGDALLYLGSVVHGGGANITTDRWRKAIYVGYLLGWLTPEESVPLSLPADIARTLPDRARELLGWSNIRGNRAESGVASQLQLWQLDRADADRMHDTYIDRS